MCSLLYDERYKEAINSYHKESQSRASAESEAAYSCKTRLEWYGRTVVRWPWRRINDNLCTRMNAIASVIVIPSKLAVQMNDTEESIKDCHKQTLIRGVQDTKYVINWAYFLIETAERFMPVSFQIRMYKT